MTMFPGVHSDEAEQAQGESEAGELRKISQENELEEWRERIRRKGSKEKREGQKLGKTEAG